MGAFLGIGLRSCGPGGNSKNNQWAHSIFSTGCVAIVAELPGLASRKAATLAERRQDRQVARKAATQAARLGHDPPATGDRR